MRVEHKWICASSVLGLRGGACVKLGELIPRDTVRASRIQELIGKGKVLEVRIKEERDFVPTPPTPPTLAPAPVAPPLAPPKPAKVKKQKSGPKVGRKKRGK